MATDAPSTTMVADLQHICSIDDIFQRHLLPYLTATDLARCEATGSSLQTLLRAASAWKILCQRDFALSEEGVEEEEECLVPIYSPESRSFDRLEKGSDWKLAYEKWNFWRAWTHTGARPTDLIQAIRLWSRFKAWLQQHNLQNILDSLLPCATRQEFDLFSHKELPSSLVAFRSVHYGQAPLRARSPDTEFFAGIFGGYSCYDNFYSMRLLRTGTPQPDHQKYFLLGMSPGNPRMFLFLSPKENDPEGSLIMSNSPEPFREQSTYAVVGTGGILSYFQTYIERLEAGIFEPAPIIPTMSTSRGISLFPNGGPMLSCAVTRGIEVRASARWFPDGRSAALNFGYSLRLRMVEGGGTCQLVGRHWAFIDGNGSVRRVDGEGVIGKQPLFFRENGKSGFVDLGLAGDEERYPDTTFYYQSQSGPVAGTTLEDTKNASVQGTFSFVPGSIESPTGPEFHVTVAPFPLGVSFPFY